MLWEREAGRTDDATGTRQKQDLIRIKSAVGVGGVRGDTWAREAEWGAGKRRDSLKVKPQTAPSGLSAS